MTAAAPKNTLAKTHMRLRSRELAHQKRLLGFELRDASAQFTHVRGRSLQAENLPECSV